MDNAYRNTDQTGVDLVLGLGASGYSCARFLARQGRDFRVADSRLEPPFARELQAQLPDVEVDFGDFHNDMLDGVGRLVVSPGIPMSTPLLQSALQLNIDVVSDIELFAWAAPAPVLAITGSNGKSTVTSWLSHLLSCAGYECRTGGNLGTPALDLLDAEIPDFYILELSSFQLERTWNLHLKAGAILNIGTDHLDHHGTLESYRKAKWQMLRHCETAVLFAPLQRESEYDKSVDAGRTSVVFYDENAGDNVQYHLLAADATNGADSVGDWLCRKGEKLLPVSVLKVVGRHNSLNALAVLAMAESCGIVWSEALGGLTSFTGLPHRMQWIGESRGVTWINDSKGTNVDATTAAIGSVTTPLVLIAGGDGKNADFAPLAHTINSRTLDVRAVIVMGKDAGKIRAAIGAGCEVIFASDIDEAVILAGDKALSGDTVLFSPACASFDMFKNYMHRGDEFVRAWRTLS